MFLHWGLNVFIHRGVKNVYYWWNTTKLWCKWTTGGRTRNKTDSPREIKQRNSARAAKKKETSGAKTKDNITSNQLSTQSLVSRGFASHVFLVKIYQRDQTKHHEILTRNAVEISPRQKRHTSMTLGLSLRTSSGRRNFALVGSCLPNIVAGA